MDMTLAVAASIVKLPTARAHAASLAAEDRAGFHDANDRSEDINGYGEEQSHQADAVESCACIHHQHGLGKLGCRKG